MSLASEFKRTLKVPIAEEIPDLVVFRPLGYALVKAVEATSITPNQLTLAAMIFGLAAGFALGRGTRTGAVLGAGLLLLYVVFDCADGQLARLKKNGTRLGRLLDGVVDYVAGIAAFAGIGTGLRPPGFTAASWWALVAAAAASMAFHCIVFDYYRNRFLDYVSGTAATIEDRDYESFAEEAARIRADRPGNPRLAAIGLYLGYLRLQKDLTRRPAVPPESRRSEYVRRNRAAMRGWTFLGTSTQVSLLAAAILAGRVEVILWAIVVGLNAWAAAMAAIQAGIDRRLTREDAA